MDYLENERELWENREPNTDKVWVIFNTTVKDSVRNSKIFTYDDEKEDILDVYLNLKIKGNCPIENPEVGWVYDNDFFPADSEKTYKYFNPINYE